MLKGMITALVTPFKNNKIDYDALDMLIDWQIANNVDGLLISGTTGESPAFRESEFKELVRFSIQKIDKRIPVLIGTGTNNTAVTIEKTTYAKEHGADAVLIVNPYYNKPSQEGLYRHFESILSSVDIPIMMYNIPGRTAVKMDIQTILAIAKHKNIVALKDATGGLADMTELLSDDSLDCSIFSGDDLLTLPMMCLGAKGVVSVIGNILPKQTTKIVHHCLKSEFEFARSLFYQYQFVMRSLFIETNPIPVKQALAWIHNTLTADVRLPLVQMSEDNQKKLRHILKTHQVIN